MHYLQEYVAQTGNLDPPASQLQELASKMEEPIAVVRQWFIRRQSQEYRGSRRREQEALLQGQEYRDSRRREREALLEERFVQNRYPKKAASEEIAQEIGESSLYVRNWFARRSVRFHATSERRTLNLSFFCRRSREKALTNEKHPEPPTSDVVLSPGSATL